MPIFFFDTDDGTTQMRDETGIELADEQAASDEGSRALGEVVKDFVPGGAPQKNLTMWIRDEDCLAVMQLSMSFAVRALK